MSFWSVDRDGVKVGEFFAFNHEINVRVVEVCSRNNPQPDTKWDLWQEPRERCTHTVLHEYTAVKHEDGYYSTYLGANKLRNAAKK